MHGFSPQNVQFPARNYTPRLGFGMIRVSNLRPEVARNEGVLCVQQDSTAKSHGLQACCSSQASEY